MLEGRKELRTATRLLVSIFPVRDPRLTDLASIENLSSRGARVTTQRPWELGSHVGIRAMSGAMSARARVVRCSKRTPSRFSSPAMRRLRRVFSTPIFLAAAEKPPCWTTEAKK